MLHLINGKILLSAVTMLAATAVVVGATFAFFSDSETSTGNTFTAGKLNLKVDSKCHYFHLVSTDPKTFDEVACEDSQGAEFGTWTQTDLESGVHKFFNFDDIKPGDRGEDTVSLHVLDNDAWGKFVIKGVVDNGELREALLFSVFLDQGLIKGFQCGETPSCPTDKEEGDNIQQPNEPTLITDGTIDAEGEVHNIWEGLATVAGIQGEGGGILNDGRLVGSTTYYFGISWELPSNVGNEVQGDSLSATMEFQVVQARNNPSKDGF